jgi:hypothetical protein
MHQVRRQDLSDVLTNPAKPAILKASPTAAGRAGGAGRVGPIAQCTVLLGSTLRIL